MSKGICMLHGKEVCKICHGCEDCGINACVHTERGKITKAVFEGIKIGCNNHFSDAMVTQGKAIVETLLKEK